MTRWFAILAVLVCAAVCASAQAFDVATIRSSQIKGGGALASTPGTLTIRNLPLRMIVAAAHGIAEYQIAGPPWLSQERFDIVAKTEATVDTQDEMLPLLRPLLTERFRLSTHRETRQLPAYVLRVARGGPKMEIAGDAAPATLPFKKANKSNGTRLHSPHITMAQLADLLAHRLGHPVHDLTGLGGAYSVTLEWSGDENAANPARNNRVSKPSKPNATRRSRDLPGIFTAVQDQLGLRLESARAPVEILVIDHIEKTPIAN